MTFYLNNWGRLCLNSIIIRLSFIEEQYKICKSNWNWLNKFELIERGSHTENVNEISFIDYQQYVSKLLYKINSMNSLKAHRGGFHELLKKFLDKFLKFFWSQGSFSIFCLNKFRQIWNWRLQINVCYNKSWDTATIAIQYYKIYNSLGILFSAH